MNGVLSLHPARSLSVAWVKNAALINFSIVKHTAINADSSSLTWMESSFLVISLA